MRIGLAGTLVVFACSLAVPANAQMVGGPGPSVLSRGGNRAGQRGADTVDFVYWAGVTGTYQTNAVAVGATPEGQPVLLDLYGVQVGGGVYGGHTWRRRALGLDYRGDYRHYSNQSGYNGSDHALSFDYSATLSRRWEFVTRQTAGTTSLPYGGLIAPQFVSSDYVSVPVNEIYNSRIYYFQSTAYAGFRKSSRTLYSFGGGGFGSRRSNKALVGVNGYIANAQYQYRLSRNLAVGGAYEFSHYDFPRAFGASDMHSASLVIQRFIGRHSSILLQLGAYRIETLGSESYALPREIAAIIGVTTGQRAFYRVNYVPVVQATASFRKQSLAYTLGFRDGISPGNGVYLTSRTFAGSAGVSYTGFRRVSYGASASYSSYSSLWQTIGKASTSQVGGGASYQLGRGLNLLGQLDWRTLTVGVLQNRSGLVATLGVSYSPNSSLPLSLW